MQGIRGQYVKAVLVFTLVLGLAGAAGAQETSATAGREARCLLASKTFSPGATIRAGAKVMECTSAGTWSETEKDAAGCFAEDQFYSTGALAGITGNRNATMTCLKDGSWSPAETK